MKKMEMGDGFHKLNAPQDEVNDRMKDESRFTYEKLCRVVETMKFTSATALIAYLIGYQGSIDTTDFENIMQMHEEGYFRQDETVKTETRRKNE